MLVGLDIHTDNQTDIVEAAQRAERFQFDFVSASDHPGLAGNREVWTMLTWIAATTTEIRVATRVLGVPLRNPALTGKMAATLDRLSKGRLILGLGGGAGDDELLAFGISVPSPQEKIDRLEAAVERIREDFSGPIWLGTFGPQALAVTGRTADGWIPSRGYRPDDELPRMRDRVLAAAAGSGRDPQEITCVLNLSAATPLDDLHWFTAAGFNAFNFQASGDSELQHVAEVLLPALRAMDQ